MVLASLTDRPRSPVGSRRSEVLEMLRASERPLAVVEVADATGLHINTARFHLDGLVEEGLAERSLEPREAPGRPKTLYAAKGAAPGPRSYGLLAEVLTGLVASLKNAGPEAVEAGRAWGRHLVERSAPSERVSADEAVTRVNSLLSAVGFAPETRKDHRGLDKGGLEVRLHHCPFREVAERHADVVCAIHLGLMQGALEELNAPLKANSLEPWVTPNVCVALLQAARASGR